MSDAFTSWDTLQTKLAEIDQISPETVRAIIDRGTEAHPDQTQQSIREPSLVLFYALGKERLGVRAQSIESINAISKITPVPGAPPFYRGVVSLHGQILSVLDPSRYLGLSPADDAAGFIVVVKGSGLKLGLTASEIYDLIDLPASELSPVDSVGLDRELVIGIAPRKLILLDVEAILSRESARIKAGTNR